jgi:hypothetical protein
MCLPRYTWHILAKKKMHITQKVKKLNNKSHIPNIKGKKETTLQLRSFDSKPRPPSMKGKPTFG